MRWLRFPPFFLRRPSHVELARQFIGAINAHDMQLAQTMLTPDFVHRDTMNYPIEPRDAFVSVMERFFEAVPDVRWEIDMLNRFGESVLAKGRILSANPDECVEGLWQIDFDGDLICAVHSFRASNANPLRRMLDTPPVT